MASFYWLTLVLSMAISFSVVFCFLLGGPEGVTGVIVAWGSRSVKG